MWTKEEKATHYAKKDALYRQNVLMDRWPQDNCRNCQNAKGCCQRYGHHVGDCCTHCGNDERNERVMKYRGKAPEWGRPRSS